MENIADLYFSIRKKISDLFTPHDGRTPEKFMLVETSNASFNTMENLADLYFSFRKKISDLFTPHDGRTPEKFMLVETSNVSLNNTLNMIFGILLLAFIVIILFLILYQLYYSIKFCFQNPLDPSCRKQFKIKITHRRSHKRHHGHRGYYGHHSYN